MYEEHPVFVQPDNEDIKVWRYMDFTKLISLIDSRRLFFARADKFKDPFEGSWPKVNVTAREIIPDVIPAEAREYFLETMRSMSVINKKWPRYHAINCWHMNEYESAAMWKLYLKSDEGIVIQSTYKKLKKSLIDDEPIYIGVVKYIDYEKDFIKSHNSFEPFIHKRKSFEHEREVRCLVIKWPLHEGKLDFSKDTMGSGLSIRTDIEILIEKIYVAPSVPIWFSELVKAVISRYGYDFPVEHSKLNEQPLF
jgi:hypothetical protein